MPFKSISILFIGLFLATQSEAQKVNKSLHLFLNNKSKDAEAILKECSKDPKNPEYAKANIALAVIKKFEEDDDAKVRHYVEGITAMDNPDPYAYPLWGDCTFYNFPDYAQKLIQFYENRKQVHPDINSALLFLKSRMWQRRNHKDSIIALNRQSAFIDKWEMLGEFDYADGYGFKNDEGTLVYPDTSHVFKGSFNGKIKWFPLIDSVDVKYMSTSDFVTQSSNSKCYMQTFIESPIEQDVLLNITCGSDIRCWVNDVLCFENRKNIGAISSIPFHLKVRLNKGINRILLQLGKKSEYRSNIDVSCTDTNFKPITGLSAQLAKRQYTKSAKSFYPTITDPDMESFNIAYFNSYEKKYPEDLLEQILRIEEFNTGNNKDKTLKAIAPLLQKYPQSHYLLNANFYNKNNVSYTSTDEYLNQNCPDCFTTLRKKYQENYDSKAKAEEYLDKMQQLYPDNYTLVFFKIRKLISEKSYSAADSMIEQSWRTLKNRLAYWEMKEELMNAQNKKEEVAKMLEANIDEICNTNLSESLADYYLEKNDSLKWLYYYLRDAQYNNEDGTYYTLAQYYNKHKKYDSVDYVFKKLMTKKPFSAYVFERYGDALLEQNKKKEANYWYQVSLDYYPEDYNLHKKMLENDGAKTELEQLLPQNIKELYSERKVNKIEVPQSLSQRAWVMLLRREANVMYASAYTRYKGVYFYKILNESGIKDFKEYSKNGDEEELLIFKTDGSIALPEGSGTWVLPDLKVGDIIGVKSESGYGGRGIHTNKFQSTIMMDNNIPTVEIDQQVLFSKELQTEPNFYSSKEQLKPLKKSWNKNYDLYEIKLNNLEYREPEVHSLSEVSNQSYFGISNFGSWKEFINWYWDIAGEKIEKNDTIKTIVASILTGKEKAAPVEKAKLIYQWVVEHINYSSQSFRQDNYVPQLPSKVIQDKLGDCKDLSALYLSLCKEAGINGHYVLVSSEAGTTAKFKRFPSNFFNHCIAVIYPEGKKLFVELTAKYLAFGQNPMYQSYGAGLIIDTNSNGQIESIRNENIHDQVLMNNTLQVDSAEILAKGTIKVLGVTSAALKEAFDNADNISLETAAQKVVTMMYPNSNQLKTTNNFKQKGNDTVQIDFDFYNHEMLIDVADLEIIKVPTLLNKMIDEASIAPETRKTEFNLAIAMGYLNQMQSSSKVIIPDGRNLYRKPQAFSLQNDFFNFSIDYKDAADGIVVQKYFLLKKLIISPQDYASFRQQLSKAYKADVNSLVLQKM